MTDGAVVVVSGDHHKCTAAMPIRRFKRVILSAVYGGFAWWVRCGGCHAEWAGTADSVPAAVEATVAVAGPYVAGSRFQSYYSVAGAAKRSWFIRAGVTVPLLHRVLHRDLSLREPGWEDVVAVDASCADRSNFTGWGFVTGAGWYGSGLLEPFDGVPLRPTNAELVAVLNAIAMFPRDMPIVVESDHLHVVEHLTRYWNGGRLPEAWITGPQLISLAGSFRRRPVTFRWAPRMSNLRHRYAHRLAVGVTRTRTDEQQDTSGQADDPGDV